MNDLLNVNELAAALGHSRWWVSRMKRQHPNWIKQFEVSRPMGQRRYSRVLVERFNAGASVAAIGQGSRAMRRAS